MRRAARSWECFGREDPLWAILTHADKRGGRWDPDEFLATGQRDAEKLAARVARWRDPRSIRRVLDFGCGVGRVTLPLADRFEEVHGVDVAASMIAGARTFDRRSQCSFHRNTRPDLRLFGDGSFDLVHSLITLQHLRPRLALRYIAEFGRILAPGGLCLFQLTLPASTGGPARRLVRVTRRAIRNAWHHGILRRPVMEMHGVRESEVLEALGLSGCEVLEVLADASAGPLWPGRSYLARATGHAGPD